MDSFIYLFILLEQLFVFVGVCLCLCGGSVELVLEPFNKKLLYPQHSQQHTVGSFQMVQLFSAHLRV